MSAKKQFLAFTPVQDRNRLICILLSVFGWGLLAHGYAFSNLTLSHDSLNEFFLHGAINYADGSVLRWKITLGRFAEPIYQMIFRGDFASPWLAGALSLIWLALAVYLVSKMFLLSNYITLMVISGFFTVNLTVTAMSATFINDIDADMFAVFLATGAAFLWNKGGKISWLSIPLIICVLGIYQCLVSVTVTLMILLCLIRLIQGEKTRNVLVKGLKATGLLILSGIIYFLFVQLSCRLFHVSLENGYDGLSALWTDNGAKFLPLLTEAYAVVGNMLLLQPTIANQPLMISAHLILLFIVFISLIKIIKIYDIKTPARILILLLFAVLPLGMNLSYVLDKGMVHHLMMYAFWLFYLVVILLLRELPHDQVIWQHIRVASLALIVMITWSGVQTANAVYVKKDMERQSTLSTMTRVTQALEETDGYAAGHTPVAFIDSPLSDVPAAFVKLRAITGIRHASQISGSNYYANYYDYILQQPMNALNRAQCQELAQDPTVEAMPFFPEEGSIIWIGDTLVIKMGYE